MIFIVIAYFTIALISVIYLFKTTRLSPATCFIANQILMFSGIIRANGAMTPNGKLLILIYLVALIFFVLGVCLRNMIKRARYFQRNTETSASILSSFSGDEISTWKKQVILFIILASIFASAYFYTTAGVNVFLVSLRNFASGENVNLSAERRDFFSLSGVGYIYQFRAILLPILTTFVVVATKAKLPFKVLLSSIMLVFLLGTGQRNAFVFFAAIFIVYWFSLSPNYRHFSRKSLIALIVIIVFFLIVLTIANGRVSAESDNNILGAIESILDRFLNVNQISAILAFDYIQSQSTSWGYDWMMMFMDILPGKSGYLSVDRIVYHLAYGTYSGTGPPCIWGSAWYNFEWLGVSIFPMVLGYVFQSIYIHFNNKANDTFDMLVYVSLSVYLGIWTNGSPMSLFNNGVVTVIMMYYLTNLNRRNNAKI